MLKKALLGLALFGVALAQDLRKPPENPIARFNPQQQGLSELERKIITVCNTFSTYSERLWDGHTLNVYPYLFSFPSLVNQCITSLKTRGYYNFVNPYTVYYVVYGRVYTSCCGWREGFYRIDRLIVSGNDVVGCTWDYERNYCSQYVYLFF